MNTELVKVNGTDIECPYENEQHYVAIRPICQALGIDYRKQFDRIKTDEILGQLVTHTVTNSTQDGKKYEMFCLPVKYVFGWIFSIDDSKINERAKPTFLKYKEECYTALYEHFFLRVKLYEQKENMLQRKRLEILEAKERKRAETEKLKQLEEEYKSIELMQVTQLSMQFPSENTKS